MRSETSTDWPRFLPLVVNALNKKPLEILGNVAPIEINSELDDIKIRDSQQKNNVSVYKEPKWQEQNLAQSIYPLSQNPFQIGQHVYLDKKIEVFSKSFFVQVFLIVLLSKAM